MSAYLFSTCKQHSGIADLTQTCSACQVNGCGAEAAAGFAGVPDGTQESRAFAAKSSRIDFLERKRTGTKADLLLKFQDDDWHGVADAAMDLRDIESELKGLRA